MKRWSKAQQTPPAWQNLSCRQRWPAHTAQQSSCQRRRPVTMVFIPRSWQTDALRFFRFLAGLTQPNTSQNPYPHNHVPPPWVRAGGKHYVCFHPKAKANYVPQGSHLWTAQVTWHLAATRANCTSIFAFLKLPQLATPKLRDMPQKQKEEECKWNMMMNRISDWVFRDLVLWSQPRLALWLPFHGPWFPDL